MDEIGRETAAGHRPSVSMPSLDSADDFGVNSESADAVFESNDSFGSAEIATTATEDSNGGSGGGGDGASISGGISVTPATTGVDVPFTTDELSSESLIGEGPTHSEDTFIQPPTETSSSESQSADLQQECLDESQGEEDPSIAIDQFIKKIADEQLSSKRIEERKEEEAQEQLDTNLDDTVKKDENQQVESEENAAIVGEKINPDSQEVNVKDENVSKSEPMDVDEEVKNRDANEGRTEELLNEDEHMAESIEEIQKEINKIPPKKVEKDDEPEKVQAEPPALKKCDESPDEKIESPKEDILKTALEKDRKVFNIQDSAEVCKDPILIEKAQEALKKLDVLVCGECHNTFYFIQELTDHKNSKCPKKSVLTGTCEAENKPQVWGFILWKTKQVKDQTSNVPSAWALYQKWCKLPQADRSAWITAGQSIQFVSKLTNAKVTEVRSVKSAKQTTVQKITGASPPPLEFIDSNKENSSSMDAESPGNYMKKGFTKPVKLNNDVTIIPSVKKDEFVVEKIMAKRFNPRKKTWEYNIKWENFGHDSNTWEPIGNLSHCKVLLEQFEEQLKRMKEEKAKQATAAPKGRGRPANPKPITKPVTSYVSIAPKTVMSLGSSEDFSVGGRPQRSSKQKAMDQVKQWCGSISDDDASDSLKRKRDTDDSDDDFDDKKIKLEEDSDYSDKDVKTRMSFRKIQSTPKSVQKVTHQVKNGSTSQQILPSNILIPDANGVVRINQKQLPALSSGVYIMSKTAGIIKLDSTTSKVATSGGQTVVKVAPKIGQTQIKIVKKDGNTTKQIIQVSPQSPLGSPSVRIAQANRSNILQKGSSQRARKEAKKSPVEAGSKTAKNEDLVTSDNQDSDSDDGLEPLPFPTEDEPIPDVNEEKADEFILDPTTGKLAGVEYVDKPVVVNDVKPPPAASVLENIVKLAVSEEDDLQGTESQAVATTIVEKKDPKQQQQQPQAVIKADQKTVEMSTGGGVRKIVKYSVAGPNVRTEVHGQTKSVVGTPVTRIVGGPSAQPQRRVVHQKVINQMVSQKVSAQPTRTVVRHVIEPARPGQGGGNLNVVRKTVTTPARPRFNLSPQKPARTYSAMGGIRQGSTAGGNKVHVYSAMSSNTSPNQTTTMVQAGVKKAGNPVVRSVGGPNVGTPRPQVVQRQAVQQQQQQQKGPVTRVVQRVVQQAPRKVPVTQQHQVAKQPTPNKPKTVISMPSLTDDTVPSPVKTQTRTPSAGQKVAEQQKAAATPKEETVALKTEAAQLDESATLDQTDWSSFTMADGENPIYVTGDDGTLYQVAGQNEQGQTILITQGPDGQQQCLLVTSEIGDVNSEEHQPSTSAVNVTATEAGVAVTGDAIAAVQTQEGGLVTPTTSATAIDKNLQTPLQIKTDVSEMEGIEEGVQDQVVAQVVRTEPPSPGGTHKVVVMLPDGNLMVTQVSKEEYASLELE